MENQGIRIQPDWDKAICEKDQSFWFHLYDRNNTRYQKVEINGDQLIPDTREVVCHVNYKKTACFRDSTRHLQSTFQCPDFRYVSIHKQTREAPIHLNSFDANASGGLAVSAASDGSVLLWESKSSQVRRVFEGHAGEVYVSRFFPSGLVVLTGSADMQLRIWCAVNGTCAAVLQAGLGGTDQPGNSNKEPGGHRSGILDVDFIDRGRNVVAVDRGGWLRLWDVSTQIAISAFSVAPRPPGSPVHANCLLDDAPVCCAVKNRVLADKAIPGNTTESTEKSICLETSSTKATTSGVTNKLVAVGCGYGGRALLFDLSTSETRRKGPVAHLTLPSGSGSVTACAAAMVNEGDSPDTSSNIFNEYGLLAGGSNGEIVCWDLRNCTKPLFTYEAYKYGVCSLRLANIPAQTVETLSGDSQSIPAFTGLYCAYRDGRVILHQFDQNGIPRSKDGFSKCLELTGPEVEPICGLSITGDQQSSVWTGTYSAQFFGYRQIAVGSLF